MGSFSMTCGVSGFPIGGGDRVRFMLLVQNPYDETCYSHGNWVPRCFPILADYNDYGTIENYDKLNDPIFMQMWLDQFKTDLIERGVGDNSFHDLATLKDWSFEEMLEALGANRIYVNKHTSRDPGYNVSVRKAIAEEESKYDPRIPTLRRVMAVIEELPSTNPAENSGGKIRGFLVDDDESPCRIRVRYDKFGGKDQRDNLERILPLLIARGWVVSIVAGSGSYASDCEIRVSPPPEATDHIKSWIPFHEKKKLLVQGVMIREDVWQACLKMEEDGEWEHRRTLLSETRIQAKTAWDDRVETAKLFHHLENNPDPDAALKKATLFIKMSSEIGSRSAFTYKRVPASRDLSDHFKDAADMFGKGLISGEQAEQFLEVAAQTIFVERALGGVRFMWRPSYSAGPQCPEWAEHLRYVELMREIALKHVREEEYFMDHYKTLMKNITPQKTKKKK